MKQIITLLSFLFLTNMVSAQDRIQPGDAAINYALIKPGYNTYKITVYDSLGKVIRDMIKIDLITIDTSRKTLTRIQNNYFPGGFILTDTTVANLKTLSPERMRMVTTPDAMHMNLVFNQQSVHAVAYTHNKFKDTVHIVQPGYFDSNLIEYVIGLLPYKDGFSAVLNAYTFEQDGLEAYKVEYMGEDILPGATGCCHLLKVTSSAKPQNGYCWIEASTGRTMKRIFRQGSNLFIITKV